MQDLLNLDFLIRRPEVGAGETAGEVAQLSQKLGLETDRVLPLTRLAKVNEIHFELYQLLFQRLGGLFDLFVLREPHQVA